nr:uncharacterized protein LOC109154094 [Ipomoea batatas]
MEKKTTMQSNPSSKSSMRCPHCAGPLSNEMETSEWTVPPLIRDSFSMSKNSSDALFRGCRLHLLLFSHRHVQDWQKSYYSVFLETEDWRGLKEDIMDISHLSIKKIQCASRVNCVAKCLVNSCKGSNVIFCSREGLPRGLGRILALEGIPHFVVAPGVDAI